MTTLQISEFLEDNYDESGFGNADVSFTNKKLTNGHSSPIVIDDIEDESYSPPASNNENFQRNSTADISIISID